MQSFSLGLFLKKILVHLSLNKMYTHVIEYQMLNENEYNTMDDKWWQKLTYSFWSGTVKIIMNNKKNLGGKCIYSHKYVLLMRPFHNPNLCMYMYDIRWTWINNLHQIQHSSDMQNHASWGNIFDLIIFKFQTYPYIFIHFDDQGLFEYPGNFDFDNQGLFNISNTSLSYGHDWMNLM